MPIYDYECQECGTIQERMSKHDAEESPPCLKCKSVTMKRLASAPSSFKFRGSGFYATDYKEK